MNALRTIFRWWATIMLVAVVVQIGFAGIGAFDALDKATAGTLNDDEAFYDSFSLHSALGTLIVLGGLLLFILSLVARAGRPRVLHSLGIFVLLFVQLVLGWTGQELPEVLGFLHPINALAILAALGILAQREWMEHKAGSRMGGATIAPPPSAAA
jgi:heme A synthase